VQCFSVYEHVLNVVGHHKIMSLIVNAQGLGEILAAQGNKNESKGDKSVKPRRVVLDGLKGQKVIARHEADGFYYLGMYYLVSVVAVCKYVIH
jgi:hypothetical protein